MADRGKERRFKRLLGGARPEIAVCLLLVVLTVIVYGRVRYYEFINYDDILYVTENRQVQGGLTVSGIVWAFTTFHASNWHPLTWVSHMVDVELFGLHPGGAHVVNLLFHLADTVLLFLVFVRMTGALWKSAFVAALFAVHPLHVESVAWIAERKDVLSAFFWMLVLWFYVSYVRKPSTSGYLAVVGLFVLGLMSKPMLVTLPFVLLLLDFWPLGRMKAKGAAVPLVREKIPLFVLSAVSCGVTLFAQKKAVLSLEAISASVRMANAAVSYAAYIGKTIWPRDLAVFYPHPGMPGFWRVVIAVLVLAGVTLAAARWCRRRPYLIVGWLWYLGTLVPVIGFVQVGSQAMADRYTYVPLVGLFVMIAWGVGEAAERFRLKLPAALAAASVTVVLMACTLQQVGYWKDSTSLFDRALKVTLHTDVIHNQLAIALEKQGKYGEAERQYEESLRINPGYAEAHFNMGNLLAGRGRVEKAEKHYRQAVKSKPDYAEAWYNLGVALLCERKYGESVTCFREALRIRPEYEEARHNLIIAEKMGMPLKN